MEVPGRTTIYEDGISGHEAAGEDQAKTERAHLCQPCQEGNILQDAYGCCITCEENLCDTCFNYHRRPKPLKNHVLVDAEYFISNDSLSSPPFRDKHESLKVIHDRGVVIEKYKTTPTLEKPYPPVQEDGEHSEDQVHYNKIIEISKSENDEEHPPPPIPERRKIYQTKCSIHHSEELKYHCRTHQKIVCSVCALKEHKQCTSLGFIHEIYETEMERIVSKIHYVEDKVAYIIKNENDANQISDASYEKALTDIRSHRERVIKYFDDIEKRLRHEYASFRVEIEKRSTDLLDISRKLKQKERLVANTDDGSETERYMEMNEEEGDVDNINKDIIGAFGQRRLHVSYKEHFSLPDLGSLEFMKQDDVGSQKLGLLKRITISRVGEVCCITDMTMPLNDSFPLILADSINKRLIVISSKYTLVNHPLQSKPWGVTYISDDKPTREIAITLPKEKIILFLNVGKKISLSKRKSIEIRTAVGIRYYRPDSMMIVIVNAKGESSVQCWSVNGEFVRTIASFNYYIDRMNLTNDGEIIFTSAKSHCLCVVDLTGKVLKSFHYIDDYMNGPYGLAADKNKSFYVCGWKCLRVVSKEKKWDNILTNNDGFCPQSVHVCDKTDRLFVGQGNMTVCSDVLIFQL